MKLFASTNLLLILILLTMSHHFIYCSPLVINKEHSSNIEHLSKLEQVQTTRCIPYDKASAQYCADVVTWSVDSETYTDFVWNNEYAIEYYQNVTSYVDFSSLGANEEKCKTAIKKVACVRSFVKCIDDQTPRLQACRRTCETAAKTCSISFDLVKSSCDESIRAVNCFDASSSAVTTELGYILLLLMALFAAAL